MNVTKVVDRAKKLIVEPQREWQAIDEEPATVQEIFTGYVMILAAVPAVASFIGLSVVGSGPFGSTYRVALGTGLTHLVAVYLMSLGGVYALALVIDGLAPKFEGKRDFEQSLKVAAYVPTPAWLAGIFNIIPALWIISFFLSLYSLYLLFLGLAKLTRVPDTKAIPFLVVVFIASIIICVGIYIVVSLTLPSKVRGF